MMSVLSVEYLPIPQVLLGQNNRIGLTELETIRTLIVRIANLQYYVPFFIKKCTIMTVKASGEKAVFTQMGNVVSDEIKKHFRNLKKGDIIIIKDVKVIREGNQTVGDADGIFVAIM